MKYRILGKSALRVSVIGLGTWQLGGEWAKDYFQEEATPILKRAAEVGINFIDTAECYGDHTSERLIGQALKDLKLRDHFLIATKFGHKYTAPFTRTEPRTGPDVQLQLEDSLTALQTDYIDLYQYHSWGDELFTRDDVRTVLEKAKAAGKVRHVGNSIANSAKTPFQIQKSDEYHVEALQIVYNRLARTPEQLFFPDAHKLNLGILARVPLASGFLSGKYKPGDRFPENDVRTKWQSKDMDDRLCEVQRIAATELPPGIPMAQWALAWCLSSPHVQCVIPGCKSPEQVESNAAVADHPFVSSTHPSSAP